MDTRTSRMRVALLVTVLAIAGTLTFPAAAAAQARSGPQSVDACGVLTKAELETALNGKVLARPVPKTQPASIGVSVCMWSSAEGQRTLSVTTYGPEAVSRTHSRTLQAYYDSVKTSNANLAGKPPQVIRGVARHASFFPKEKGKGGTLLILRQDCVITMNVTGLSPAEVEAVAKAAGA